MACDLLASANFANVLAYVRMNPVVRPSRVQTASETVRALLAFVEVVGLRTLRELKSLYEEDRWDLKKKKMQAMVSLRWQLVKSAFFSFQNPAESTAKKAYLLWKCAAIQRMTAGYGRLVESDFLQDPETKKAVTISDFIGDGLLVGEQERANRFILYYFNHLTSVEDLVSDLYQFLVLPNCTSELPPLFINSNIYLESTKRIDSKILHRFWLAVAKIRLELFCGSRRSSEERIVKIMDSLSTSLSFAVNKATSSARITFLKNWLYPKTESFILKNALKLPLFELLHPYRKRKGKTPTELQKKDRQQIFAVGEKVLAHGISEKRGGVCTLINIMLEGQLLHSSISSLIDGDPKHVAGPHGPYYIIVSWNKDLVDYEEGRDYSDREIQAFVVPGEREKQLVVDVLQDAFRGGFLTYKEQQSLCCRLFTYQQCCSAIQQSTSS